MAENKSGSMLCPNCGQLISINAEECIHCGRKNPGMWGLVPAIRSALGQYGVTEVITVVCVVLYAFAILLEPSALFRPRGFLGFLSPSDTSLARLGMTGGFAMARGYWWTLITAIYLHGGLLHIFFNLMWVRQLGPEVENLFGTARLILIFTISGILGFLLSNFITGHPTIGASGSIFGLLGAIIYYGRARGGSFGTLIYRQTLQWAAIMFLFGFMFPGINNWAHGGGFAGGYITAMLVGFSESRTESFTTQMLAMAVVALTVVSFGFAIFTGVF